MNLGLKSKTALVSGSTAGIGLAIAPRWLLKARRSSSMAAPRLAWMLLSISFASA
jgi:NAD(P)-dependent dehydrogenase (short-subunit alcohol dehydrogenase family)